MATITFSGLTSGLDTSSWVDALVSVKQTTITSLQAQQEAQQKLLSVVNNIKSFFSSFQTCLQKITDSQFGIASIDLFMQNLATSSNTNILTATATTEAARQTYDVLVDQLATSTKATSGYTKSDTMYATLDTTLGKLGAKSGTITVNNQSFTISEKDTIKDLIDKFSNVGIVASFDSKKSRFTVGAAINEIDDGATGLKNVLGLQNTNINGVASGSMVYATRDTKLADLGLTEGRVTIGQNDARIPLLITKTTGKKYHLFTYGIDKDVDTLGDLLDTFNSLPNAEATIDDKGNISIRGMVLESVAGGSNLKEILNLGDVTERTVMESNRLTWKKTHSADLTTTLHNLGITGDKTLSIDGGTATSISDTTTLQNIKDTLAASGIDMSIDENGVITIDTNGKTLSGTLLDALGLVADKSGTTLTSNAHTVTYKADGSTLLSDLGITNADTCTPYKSNTPDGAVGRAMNNLAGLTIDEFITRLKASGVDASFDKDTQQIIINDGYITGEVATKLGMTSTTETYQVAATTNTTLAKLGATDKQTLNINGTAKEYEKTATLSNIISDITDAGGTVELKDGIMKVSGVTLTGSLAALLGFSATTKGTSVTSGALSVVTNSSSTSSSAVNETQKQPLSLSDPLSFLTSSTATYTLSLNGGTAVYYDPTTTLNDIKTAVETAGGTLTINDDNTISIEGVTLSGTLVTALGLASVGTATSMTSNTAITVGGVQEFATESNTLIQLGVRGETGGFGGVLESTTNKLYINGTEYTFTITSSTLGDVFDKIKEACGTAEVKDGVIKISGVSLRGRFVNDLGLEVAQSGTTVTSGELTYTASMTSTSSASLNPVSTVPITNSTTLSNITGATDSTSYTSSIGGTSKNYTGATTLSTIKADIANAGGTMTIDSDGKITITGVNVSGAIVDVLGLTSEGKSTSISSNSPITLNQSFLVQGSTTIGSDLGVSTANRSYAIYDNYGNIIASTSTDGATGSATINDWLTSVNSKMNTYYGTSGVTYAKIDNGVISVDKGYVSGNLPSAIGMTTTSTASGKTITGVTVTYGSASSDAQTSTTLSQLGLTTASDRTISLNVAGQSYTQTFQASDTIQDVLDYLNGLSGVSASFENSQFRVTSNNSQNLTVGGKLATALFGGSMSESTSYEVHNANNKLYYSKSNLAMSEATRIGDLLGTDSGGTLNITMNDSTQIVLNYNADSTVGDVLLELANYGITASVSSSGVFSATSQQKITLSGDVGRALLGANGTTTYADNRYSSGQLSVMNQLGVTGGVSLDAFGISSGNIQITDKDGNLVTTFDIDNTQTLSQVASALSAYGFTLSIDSTNKKVTVTSANGNKLADGTSNLVSKLKLDTWTDTTSELTEDTTLAQMGFANGSSMSVVLDGTTTMNLSFGANNTVDDVITSLAAFGITATVTDGVFSATSNSHSFVFTGDLGSALIKGTAGYITTAIGYESKNPITYNTATDTLKTTTTISDLLGSKEGGTLRLTLDGNVINLEYNADDTVQEVIDDLANLGINATISDAGVFSASSSDKTFVLSGNIGRALQGGAPTYTQNDTKYKSGDLSYDTTSAISNSSVLKDIGITSGSIFVLDRNGNVINTIDIDENMTINQTKAALKSYGIDMSLADGKVTVSSNDGYSLIDGSSNMITQFKLPAFTQITAKLTAGTTLAQMGFKEGADLNLLLDGTTPTTISFGATDTMQDIINSLQALGINCSIDATNGAFTATSTEHSFVFSGDLGKFLTSGTTGYVNSDKGYITDEPLMVDVPLVTATSKGLTYSHALNATDTVESMGFANGGVVRLILDGSTPYALSFLATDTMQDIMDTLATYGVQTTIDAQGKVSFSNNDHTITLGGELGSYLTSGGTYTNKSTGYTSSPLSFETTENVSEDTKLSDMGVASGALNIIKDGQVVATVQTDKDTTVKQLFSAIKPYGMEGSIIGGGNILKIYSEGDTYLADGTCDAVTKLGLHKVDQGDYDGHVEYWKADTTTGLLTEDMLLTSFDKNGKTSVGSLIFTLGTGDDATQHIVNLSSTDTIKSFLDKMNAEGVHAVLDNGVIKLDNSVDGITFTGGSSGIRDTLGLNTKVIDTYSTSSRALSYQEDVTYSVANYADKDTTLSTVNVTSGKMSIFVDGVKAEVTVNETDKFSDIFSRISSAVAAKTGVTVRAGFVDTDGNIVADPTTDKNTGIIGIEVVGNHTLVVGASNDTTNFATIANLKQQSTERVAGSRALYKVNGNSLITSAGLFKDGDITEGDFTIGDATFTIDSTTTLNSLINQINKSDKSYASAYWDTLSGTLVLQSTLSGESLINIESGSSNFTKIMGFTETVAGKETLVTDRQTLGQNAIVRINGTTVTSTSNTITSDVSKIKGLTINLKGVSAGETVTIKVEQDDEGIYNAVNDIIDSYNALMEGLEKELGDGGSFEHDTMFSMMRNQLKRLMTQSVGGTTIYKNLAAIGISTGEAQDSISTDVTSLIIDKDKFMQALDKDSDAVKQLLVGTTANPGVFLKVNQIVDSTLKTTGYIASTENSINKNIKKMGNKISDLTTALNKYREQLQTKFSSMERVISNMQNSYSSFLKG